MNRREDNCGTNGHHPKIGTACCLCYLPVEFFRELTSDEAALLHRLELKVERALYRVAVGLTQLDGCKSPSTHSWLVRIWGDKRKVESASIDAKVALQELLNRQLYRSTHECFNQYVSERFGWSKEEIYPEACDTPTPSFG